MNRAAVNRFYGVDHTTTVVTFPRRAGKASVREALIRAAKMIPGAGVITKGKRGIITIDDRDPATGLPIMNRIRGTYLDGSVYGETFDFRRDKRKPVGNGKRPPGKKAREKWSDAGLPAYASGRTEFLCEKDPDASRACEVNLCVLYDKRNGIAYSVDSFPRMDVDELSPWRRGVIR